MVSKNIKCLRKRKKRKLVERSWYSERTDYWSRCVLTNHWQCPCVEHETETHLTDRRGPVYEAGGWYPFTRSWGTRIVTVLGIVSGFIAADGWKVSNVVLEAVLISTVWLPYLPHVHHSPDNHHCQISHRAFWTSITLLCLTPTVSCLMLPILRTQMLGSDFGSGVCCIWS
jgi:hypothetical protein